MKKSLWLFFIFKDARELVRALAYTQGALRKARTIFHAGDFGSGARGYGGDGAEGRYPIHLQPTRRRTRHNTTEPHHRSNYVRPRHQLHQPRRYTPHDTPRHDGQYLSRHDLGGKEQPTTFRIGRLPDFLLSYYPVGEVNTPHHRLVIHQQFPSQL